MQSSTITNQNGEFHFDRFIFGKFGILPDDIQAGYPAEVAWLTGNVSQVELTPENPDAKVRLVLPARNAFLELNVTNQQTGKVIPEAIVKVELADGTQHSGGFKTIIDRTKYHCTIPGCPLFIPADTPMLLHISATGFREWNESANGGKLLFLESGSYKKLDIQLDPAGN